MPTVFRSTPNVAGAAIAVVLGGVVVPSVSNEVVASPPPLRMTEAAALPNEELASRADVVVHGTIESIAIERGLSNLFDDRTYTATLVVDRVERGEDVESGSRLEVRYWRRDALDESVTDSVAGYMPLPTVGASTWLFASPEEDGTYTPVMPNGWNPDIDAAPDPTGLYGGTVTVVRDQRTGSLTPLAIGLLAAAAGIGAASLRVGPQSRSAVLLVAGGIAVSGLILLIW